VSASLKFYTTANSHFLQISSSGMPVVEASLTLNVAISSPLC